MFTCGENVLVPDADDDDDVAVTAGGGGGGGEVGDEAPAAVDLLPQTVIHATLSLKTA